MDTMNGIRRFSTVNWSRLKPRKRRQIEVYSTRIDLRRQWCVLAKVFFAPHIAVFSCLEEFLWQSDGTIATLARAVTKGMLTVKQSYRVICVYKNSFFSTPRGAKLESPAVVFPKTQYLSASMFESDELTTDQRTVSMRTRTSSIRTTDSVDDVCCYRIFIKLSYYLFSSRSCRFRQHLVS